MVQGITRRERQVTDPEEIRGILERGRIVHVGINDGEWPYVVPMNYGHTFEDGVLTLYLHCAKTGHKLDLLRADPRVFFEIDTDLVPFEGITACHYGLGYSSIMGRGTATLIETPEEKKTAMSILMKTQTGKDFTFDDRMVSVVTVIRIDVSVYTAKKRPVPPAKPTKNA